MCTCIVRAHPIPFLAPNKSFLNVKIQGVVSDASLFAASTAGSDMSLKIAWLPKQVKELRLPQALTPVP